MSTFSARVLLWSPRVLGIVLSLLLAMFALDAFSEGKTFNQALVDVAIHLAPAVVLLAIVAASWRREWVDARADRGSVQRELAQQIHQVRRDVKNIYMVLRDATDDAAMPG